MTLLNKKFAAVMYYFGVIITPGHIIKFLTTSNIFRCCSSICGQIHTIFFHMLVFSLLGYYPFLLV